MGASAEGAEMMIFLAPFLACAEAFSVVVNTPVDSTTYSAPAANKQHFLALLFPHKIWIDTLAKWYSKSKFVIWE